MVEEKRQHHCSLVIDIKELRILIQNQKDDAALGPASRVESASRQGPSQSDHLIRPDPLVPHFSDHVTTSHVSASHVSASHMVRHLLKYS
jgi:hypothetical protein